MDHIVIVGASAAGSTTARTLRREGFTGALTVIGDEPHLPYDRPPLSKQVLLGSWPADRTCFGASTTYAEQGINLKLNARAERVDLDRRVVGLATGEQITYDHLVIATGVQPITWLEDSGLPLDDGVLCDQVPEGVSAVGDVARWISKRFGLSLRLEHRFNATEQAVAVARNLLNQGKPFDPIPYFWTDQYDAKIQVYGVIPADARLIIQGDPAERRFVAQYLADGRLSAVLGWNMPRELRAARASLPGVAEQI